MEVILLITRLLEAASKLLLARGDAEREEEALMEAQELLKEELDRRRFGP